MQGLVVGQLTILPIATPPVATVVGVQAKMRTKCKRMNAKMIKIPVFRSNVRDRHAQRISRGDTL